MTDLEVRRIPFEFDDDVPFAWHPTNPEFGMIMNAISLFIIGFEKYIVDAVRAAEPLITDDAVAEEADAFLRQEAVHARAHRAHQKALQTRYPELKQTLDDVIAQYKRLFDERPLEFHLAYAADLEASFTPYFQYMLDHHDEFFEPGHEQVASMLLWHFTEEIEHRSSALVIYEHVVGRPWYRLRQLPAVLRHTAGVVRTTVDGFNRHVPLEDRLVDARCMYPDRPIRRKIAGRVPFLTDVVAAPVDLSYPDAMHPLTKDEEKDYTRRLIGSQRPSHDPHDQPLPAFAAEWKARYERGDDVTRWYSSQRAS